ncbi:SPW repeat domain-containing protein [Hymenobacter koreensis]|uniref:SPW repeat-containing integral membrane domain-containing protein n=1 Tax=Hymenobacter koreensis TaxID=1084523 RepID=A0ABP8IXD5_9BACT
MRILSPPAHGVLDYITAIFFGMAPFLFDLQHPYSTAFYVLGVGYLLIALMTDYPLGWMRVIPFPIHGATELVSGLVFIVLPFLFGFSDEQPVARNLFIGSGIVFLFVWLITDWKAQTHTMLTDAHERRH